MKLKNLEGKMVAGRPRTTSFSPEEMIELGKEMIQWLNDHPDTVHLSEFYTIHKGFIEREWKTMIERMEFTGYYEQALRMIGIKYLKEDTGIEPRIKDRWLRIYFGDLRRGEDADKDADMIRQKTVAEAVPEDVKLQTAAMLAQLESSRKSASNINKSE
jgi:hypothetical protein